MSITGELVLYQRFAGRGSLRARFQQLVELTGAEKATIVSRSRWPFSDGKPIGLGTDQPSSRSVEELLRIQCGLGTLSADLSAPSFGNDVQQRLLAEIPEAIRDQFAPPNAIVCMGWHLIDDLAPGRRGPDPSHRRAARLSFTLFGYGCPNNWDEYRARIWETDVMRELEGRIVEAIGPVRRAISWSV